MTNYVARSIWLECVTDVDHKIYTSTKPSDYQMINNLFIDYELFATILN